MTRFMCSFQRDLRVMLCLSESPKHQESVGFDVTKSNYIKREIQWHFFCLSQVLHGCQRTNLHLF